ncbi:MAG: hypothetical protein R3236_03195 [Phycisphaeraceae bacterium]|nr:hypothetical protein [Phycisphaeraceae bacterium]
MLRRRFFSWTALGLIVLTGGACLAAKEAPHQLITISFKAPATNYRVKIKQVRQVGKELWVLAEISKKGLGGQAITTISDRVKVYNTLRKVRFFATGKTWNWKNKADVKFIDSEKDLGKRWASGEPLDLIRDLN